MLKEKVRKLVEEVDWSAWETAYGRADQEIPYYVQTGDGRGYMPKAAQSLLDLFSEDKEKALQAAHDLWCGLCHQHSYVSSAALPAYDILMLALCSLNDEMKVELLDIFAGFAACTSEKDLHTGGWRGELRERLETDRPVFQQLSRQENEDVASFAELVLEYLDGTSKGQDERHP